MQTCIRERIPSVMSIRSKLDCLKDRLSELERYYNAACVQLTVLNVSMEELTKRYEVADKDNHRTFRYSLRMRMAITEGVRNMFYEFATCKAFEISKVRQEILVEHAFLDDSSDDTDDIDYLQYDLPVFVDEGDDTLEEEEEDDDEDDDDSEGDMEVENSQTT